MERDRKPLLMYFTCGDGEFLKTHQTFCSVSDPSKYYYTWNSALTESMLLTVQHGWYLWQNMLSKYVSSNLFLWSPYNLKKIMLPRLVYVDDHANFRCILSSPPSANDDQTCSIFIFPSYSLSMFYYQLGDAQWTEVHFYKYVVSALAMQGKELRLGRKAYFDNPAYCNGRVYAGLMTYNDGHYDSVIVVIEKVLNGFTVNCTTDLMVKHHPTNFQQLISHLIGSNNVLFRVEISHQHDRVTAVFVYKFDCARRVWEKVESIKDKVFYISSTDSAFACEAINQETEGGRVYIALTNCNFVYIYNIQDNCFLTSHHFSNLSENRSYSRWFMPDTEMATSLEEELREKKNICDVVYLKDAEEKTYDECVLLLELVELIAKHINDVLDYMHFRASNKFFRLAAPPIQWRSSSSMSRFDDRSMCPLFVFSKDNIFTFVNPKHGLEYKYNINFPQHNGWSLNSESCYSKDGWLLMVSVNKEFQVFFNPFTKQMLPLSHKIIENTSCFGMSHSPTSSECVTVHMNKEFLSNTEGFLQHLWDRSRGLFSFKDKEFHVYNVSPAFHNGLFYFLSRTGNLAVVEATTEHYNWKVLKEPQAPCNTCFNNFLVECDGNLLSVFESPMAKGIQVFKLNESTMTWIKVESLKNHMLFVGKTSFSAVANIPGMENKIYFPRFYGQNFVFYSLETNNYHTFQNDQVINFHHVREHLTGVWIQPRWH
ncbi:unnamed protein product [Lathyrus sativus]|nr:unnamed protein product [Lathyrus sativus]